MTAATGNPKGRPLKLKLFGEREKPFVEAFERTYLDLVPSELIIRIDAAIQQELQFSICKNPDSYVWIETAFAEVRFWLVSDKSTFCHKLENARAGMQAKNFRAGRFIRLLALSFEAASGKRAAGCNEECKGIFFRFVWTVIQISHAPIIWPTEKLALRSAISRALKKRDDPRERDKANLARYNLLYGKRGKIFPSDDDYLQWPESLFRFFA
jgi:hypothetical protein